MMRKLPQTGAHGKSPATFRAWLATWLQDRRRSRQSLVAPVAPAILLTSDGHGRLSWALNFTPLSDASQPGVPYDSINIYKSADGVTWPPNSYDGWDIASGSRDCSGDAGYFRICVCDWDGNDVSPYSNAVYSDGL